MSGPGGERIHVAEGEVRVEAGTDVVLATILGSCVAACLFDRAAGVGGMNHFLLAGCDGPQVGAAERYGAYLMEVLVNGLLQRGARRDRLEAKLFGGAAIGMGSRGIGSANADFAKTFLHNERFPLVGGSLGGVATRRVEFWPSTGRARQIYVNAPPPPPPLQPVLDDVGAVEFF